MALPTFCRAIAWATSTSGVEAPTVSSTVVMMSLAFTISFSATVRPETRRTSRSLISPTTALPRITGRWRMSWRSIRLRTSSMDISSRAVTGSGVINSSTGTFMDSMANLL